MLNVDPDEFFHCILLAYQLTSINFIYAHLAFLNYLEIRDIK